MSFICMLAAGAERRGEFAHADAAFKQYLQAESGCRYLCGRCSVSEYNIGYKSEEMPEIFRNLDDES